MPSYILLWNRHAFFGWWWADAVLFLAVSLFTRLLGIVDTSSALQEAAGFLDGTAVLEAYRAWMAAHSAGDGTGLGCRSARTGTTTSGSGTAAAIVSIAACWVVGAR